MLSKVAIRHRELRAANLEEPFAARGTRKLRVVVDPRLGLDQVDPVLRSLLPCSHFEVGSVGRGPDDTVRLHEPNREYNVVPVTYGRTHTAIAPLDNLEGFADARSAMYGLTPPSCVSR